VVAGLGAHRHYYHGVRSIAVVASRSRNFILLRGSAVPGEVRELLLARHNLDLLDFSDSTGHRMVDDYCIGVEALKHAWVHDDVRSSVGIHTLNGDLVFGVVVLVQHNECFISEGVPQELSGGNLLNQTNVSLRLGSHILHNHVVSC